RGGERLGLRGGRVTEAVDIMMAVTLGMGDADEGPKREILLHGKAGLAGQVLSGDEELLAARAPFRRARRVDDGLEKPFAGFRGDALIDELPRPGRRAAGI